MSEDVMTAQADPWNGCEACRREYERGVMPLHDWTHGLRSRLMRRRGPGQGPGQGPAAREPAGAEAPRGAAFAAAGVAVAGLAAAAGLAAGLCGKGAPAWTR